ncbi:MAG: hypothetical protein ABI197_03525 [Granulicella sp.]
MPRFNSRIILFVALVFCLPVLHAQGAAEKDLDELSHYTLTMDKVTRVQQTFPDIKALIRSNPGVATALATDSGKTHTIAEVERRITAYPQLVAIFTQHGLTPHEFIVVELTLVQSAFAFAAQQAGEKLSANNHVNPANIAFIAEHKAELEALQKKYPMGDAN